MARRLALVALALLLIAPLAAVGASAARIPGIVILVDMSHGQNPGGLADLMKLVPEAYWIVLVASPGDEENLPKAVLKLADEIRYGGFTPDTLAGVDMVIIGQPTLLPDPAEIQALVQWFNGKGIRAIWVAADSDYPAQGSETSQQFANQVLEAIGSKLRLDYVSVEDEESYAGRTYRVIGIVDPVPKDRPSALLAYVASKVLFHGPGAVYALDANGNPVNPIETPVDNVCVIVRTSEAGKIVEHQTTEGGGISGVFYQVGQTGMFPLLAIERVSIEPLKTVIASGESPYSGYQAMVTWEYKGIPLDGPNFVKYLIYMAVGYFAPFKSLMELKAVDEKVKSIDEALAGAQSAIDSLKGTLNTVSGKVDSLSSTVDQLSSKVSQLEGDLNTVKSDLGTVKSDVDKLKTDVSAASDAANKASGKAGNALAVGVLALIIALGAVGLAFTRK